tara:strand:+ start:5660 stop:5863 length:204 start_codon:yes stop_codon:yes gene_type:complete
MKALISPMEVRENGCRVAEVALDSFPVAPPLFWVDCDDSIVADLYIYVDGQFVILAGLIDENATEVL